MSRNVSLLIRDNLVQREMPDATSEVLHGVLWGDPWTLFTPAYWMAQAWMSEIDLKPTGRYSVKHGVVGELGFCMLGGYGITAELATAAYERCWDAGLFSRYETRPEVWAAELSAPLRVGCRQIKYRYPNQKSRFLAAAMQYVQQNQLRMDSGLALREQLLNITGVGYKIASWVARNVLDSDEIAILDIHILRAGLLCGLFSPEQRVERHYKEMEARFLLFCEKLQVRPSALDYLIWGSMRSAGPLPLRLLDPKPDKQMTLHF
jgi:thermostable 8-oxoguanine DNA glycosylase